MDKRNILNLCFIASLSFSSNSIAETWAANNNAFNFWSNDGWQSLNDPTTGNNNDDGGTAPGSGGQRFDAEYFFYKYDAASNNLSIGLQAGFDLRDMETQYGGQNYYGGDLALSFDNDVVRGSGSTAMSNSYEYAVDFGEFTASTGGSSTKQSYYSGGRNGVDTAGLYKIKQDNEVWNTSSTDLAWHNDIPNWQSSPFAMDEGLYVAGLLDDSSGKSGYNGLEYTANYSSTTNNTSYFRTVTFNLDSIVALGETFTVDSHWTMSCGNDDINGQITLTRNNGTTPVPEPTITALIGIGSLSILVSGMRRRKMIK